MRCLDGIGGRDMDFAQERACQQAKTYSVELSYEPCAEAEMNS